ncbi:MAG: DUF6591 domain-containing protein [Coriobacteriales bacterium]
MQKYNGSSDTSSMMADYATYMEKYADAAAKIEAMDTDNMSEADYAYYLEVTARVEQKLLNVAL